MPAPPIIAFTAVPLRRRADGWSPELQLRFILALAGGLAPGEAARAVGKNRQTAYALRKRTGAESFAAAWDAAVAHARQPRTEHPPSRAPLPQSPPSPARRALHEALRTIYGSKSDSGTIRGGKPYPMGSRTF